MSVLENPGVRLENPRCRLSRVTATVFAVLLVTGIAEGAADYARRSPKIERHVAGTNAITLHVLIAGAAAAAGLAAARRPPEDRRRNGKGTRAYPRQRDTSREAPRHVARDLPSETAGPAMIMKGSMSWVAERLVRCEDAA